MHVHILQIKILFIIFYCKTFIHNKFQKYVNKNYFIITFKIVIKIGIKFLLLRFVM